jgi:spore coat polysaccharide biosynthesis protein SpsF
MSTLCIIQARCGSSRLPGKILEPILGVSMLAGIIRRLQQSRLVDELVVATTRESSDDPVVAIASASNCAVVRGSTFDVLDRFHDALVAYPDTDVVVRVTADCPFIDPDLVDDVIRARLDHKADFASNRLPPPYQRTFPVGLDVEVCTAIALEKAWKEAVESHCREHVMPFLYAPDSGFRVHVLDLAEDLSNYRWTVDTPQDLEAVREIAVLLPASSTSWRDVLGVVRQNSWLSQINGGQAQKHVEEVDARWLPDIKNGQR